MMNTIFIEELREDWLTIYMDDILVHTPNDPETHRRRVHQVLTKLKDHDLYLKLEKCQFEQKKVEFLGVILSAGTVISSASGMERGEVFYGPTDWLGSRDPMTHYDYAP
jgi:hypothetical protein